MPPTHTPPPLRYSSTRSLLCRHRHARDLYIDREESASGGEVKRFPVIAAEGDVRSGGGPPGGTAKLPAPWGKGVENSRAAPGDGSRSVDPPTLWHTRLG